MSNPGLAASAGEWLSRAASAGLSAGVTRELDNGLQVTVRDGGRSCRANLYWSAGRGLSMVFSGGDRDLFSALPPARGWAGGVVGGSDEAGKGDYFGPLVAAAVALDPDAAERLSGMGMTDSKLMSRQSVLRVEEAVLDLASSHSVAAIHPTEYNDRFSRMRSEGRNSLDMLAAMHGSVISAIAGQAAPGVVFIDRFCPETRMRPYLPKGVEYVTMPRAERIPAVAAASVLARAAYLRSLDALSEECGIPLKPGAGADIDSLGRRLVAELGEDWLPKAAKLHFANTARILRTHRS